jgi:hypothetical protein
MPAFAGTRALNGYLLRRFTYLRAGGTYCCRQNSASTRVPTLSVHATGRAIDLMVPTIQGDADNTRGDAVANWLVENAEFIGIQRVVWDRSFWNGERGFGALGSGSLSHTDHLHIELSVAGAREQTPFFTSGAVSGTTCTARCDGTRAVQTNCSTVDCAATGAPCLAGPPPRCGTPPPAEPAASTRVAGAALPVARLAAPTRLTMVTPRRLFDTRTPEGAARLVRSAGAGVVAPGSTATYRDWTLAEAPASPQGAWLNLVAVDGASPGFVTVAPTGQASGEASALNYVAATARANAVVSSFGDGAGVTFSSSSAVHLIGDAVALFAPTGAGLDLVAPTRALDTRGGAEITAGAVTSVDVGAPAGATGVVANVTLLGATAPGFARVFACGAPASDTSSLNFGAATVVNNMVASALGGGRLCLTSSTSAHVIVDVVGFLGPTGALAHRALTPPVRVLDTRSATSLYTGRLGARQIVEVPIGRVGAIPADVRAATVNLTVVSASGPGFLTAFACGGAAPNVSSLNFNAEGAHASLTIAPLSAGTLCVFASTRVHLIVDLVGVWSGAAPPATDAGTPPPGGDEGDDLPPETPPDAGEGRDASGAIDAATHDAPHDTPHDATHDGGTVPDTRSAADAGCACHATRATPTRHVAGWVFALLCFGRTRRRVYVP